MFVARKKGTNHLRKMKEIDKDEDRKNMLKWFIQGALPIVASDWSPHKNWMDRPYTRWVSTSDEMMTLWLLNYYPERRQRKAQGATVSRNSYKKLNDSINWFFREAKNLKKWKDENINYIKGIFSCKHFENGKKDNGGSSQRDKKKCEGGTADAPLVVEYFEDNFYESEDIGEY